MQILKIFYIKITVIPRLEKLSPLFIFIFYHISSVYFSAFTLLVGRQEERPACKHWVMRCWCGCLSGARCRLFAYGPADATASPNPIISSSFKSRLVLPFWYRHTKVQNTNKILYFWNENSILNKHVREKRPLNFSSSGSSNLSNT